MVAAIGLPRERLCTYCWNGEYGGTSGVTDVQTWDRTRIGVPAMRV